MRRLPFTDDGHVVEAATEVARIINSDGVVLLPTETFYGLGAAPWSPRAVERIFAMKARPTELSLPVLCADWQQVADLVEIPDRYRSRLSMAWPGPLTAVLPIRRPVAATRGAGLAVRIPGHARLRAVLFRVGPLTGTSANRHGEPAVRCADDALASLAVPPDLVLEGGVTEGGSASTLVELTGSEERVLRTGSVRWI